MRADSHHSLCSLSPNKFAFHLLFRFRKRHMTSPIPLNALVTSLRVVVEKSRTLPRMACRPRRPSGTKVHADALGRCEPISLNGSNDRQNAVLPNEFRQSLDVCCLLPGRRRRPLMRSMVSSVPPPERSTHKLNSPPFFPSCIRLPREDGSNCFVIPFLS